MGNTSVHAFPQNELSDMDCARTDPFSRLLNLNPLIFSQNFKHSDWQHINVCFDRGLDFAFGLGLALIEIGNTSVRAFPQQLQGSNAH